jgi:kynurenine formamidase
MTTYPGLPGPRITDYLGRAESRGRYAPGVEFRIGRIELVANTGTYLDAPEHRYAGAADLADLPLERLADLPGVTVDATGQRAVTAGLLAAALGERPLAGHAVLLHTGGDRHFGEAAYAQEAPYLTADGTAWLVERRPAVVGIDSVNIDDVADPARPAHSGLLRAGVLVVEHLTGLAALPPDGYRFFAAPPRIEGLATFPVRAFALLQLAG